ncbi:unnamed protein product [Amoebophrya sp. A25]|nr:unnamed protein product [Amoebophrya sp. A25]|eukprot:GSA25T00020832001.1
MDAGFLELSAEASTPAATVCATCSLQSAAKVDGAANTVQSNTDQNLEVTHINGLTGNAARRDTMGPMPASEAPKVELNDEGTRDKAISLQMLLTAYLEDDAASVNNDACPINRKSNVLDNWLARVLYAGDWKQEPDGTRSFSKETNTDGSVKLSAFGECIEKARLEQYTNLESRARSGDVSAGVSRPLERGEELLKKLTIMVANDMSGGGTIAQCVASKRLEDKVFWGEFRNQLRDFRIINPVTLMGRNTNDPFGFIQRYCADDQRSQFLHRNMSVLWQILDLQRELRTAKGVLNSRFAGSFPDEAKVDLSKESITNLFIDKEVLKHLVEELEKMKVPLAEGTGSS